MKQSMFYVIVIGVFLSLFLSTQSSKGQVMRTASPPLTAIANPPINVKSGGFFTYSVSATDSDTIYTNGQPPNVFFDTTTNIRVIVVRSTSDEPNFTRRGTNGSTVTYDFSGHAQLVTADTVYVDEFQAYNDRQPGDPFLDQPQGFAQQVHVTP